MKTHSLNFRGRIVSASFPSSILGKYIAFLPGTKHTSHGDTKAGVQNELLKLVRAEYPGAKVRIDYRPGDLK